MNRVSVPALRGIRRVAADTWWVVRDCAHRHGGRVFLVVALGVAGQLLMIAAIASAVLFVQAVQQGGTIDLSRRVPGLEFTTGISVDAESSLATLIAVIGVLFTVVVVSALFQWWSRALGAHIVRRYEDDCTRRALHRLGEALARTPAAERDATADRALKRSLLKLVTRDTRYCGRVANEAVLAATPALTAVGAVAVLLWLGWVPLVVLFAVILAVSPLYVRVNRRGMQAMIQLQTRARADALAKSEVIRQALESPRAPATEDEAPDDPQTKLYLDAYETRLKMAHASLLVGNILFAAALCAILLFYGLFHGRGIGPGVVLYLIGLQYLMFSLRSIGKHVTNISVYHPSFSRYVQFMRTGSLTGLLELTDERVQIAPGDDELLEESLQEA